MNSSVDPVANAEGLQGNSSVAGDDRSRAKFGAWYDDLLPVLDQASHYTTPTYYLDTRLRILDWNIAFELIFDGIVDKLRGYHVTQLISRLDNFDEVIAHANRFMQKIAKHGIPYVDREPIRYQSLRYGPVRFEKVATQLHDTEGRSKGWSVALMLREIDWDLFLEDFEAECRNHKLWSVYAPSYDNVLTGFPAYRELISDVISAVPRDANHVVDLGAGTGNVTAELLESGCQVTAVENNLGMLARFRSKGFSREQVNVFRVSLEHLRGLPKEKFDAAVMVNALYAVNDPLVCLQESARILKPGGVLAFSTTHSETRLDPLLNSIKEYLLLTDQYTSLEDEYEHVKSLNKQIEKEIARRYSRDQYREWTRQAGFEITRDVPNTYEDAVMLIHARKS